MPVQAFIGLAVFVALLWLVALADWAANLELARFGVSPRDMSSLIGIPLHVFIHGGFWHVLSNTGPILVLGGLIAFTGGRNLLLVSVFVTLFAGAGVWLIGRDASHIGASGLAFGYFGYLLARGFYERSIVSIIVAIAVAVMYGGLIFGILPTNPFVSWEGHLMGLIGGVICAWMFRRRDRPNERSQ